MAERFIRWDPVNYLHTEDDIRGYFVAAIEEDEGDGRLILAVLKNIARAMDEKGLAEAFAISSKELCDTISADGFPCPLRQSSASPVVWG